ncbi:hypothetical protein POTOM_046752 [Populus tomentosa]|uniref:Non-haem dioxygenase N-terminal domain-containing protein n=1 Tax=Populus tomentosa TaxID=118781 RepID=A0A8X7YGM1_POPTO|nr:hypothetical protein POTOM_046752 [Populus tomentosa]
MATGKPVLLSDLVSIASYVPSNYIRPVSDRPKLSEVLSSDGSIPLIDLQGLEVLDLMRHCKLYYCLKVENHGIPNKVIDGTLRVSKESSHLTERERLENYSDDPTKTTRLSTSFNVKTEIVSSWRDFPRLHCYNFVVCREDVAEYCRNARELSLRLLEAISESLCLETD